MGNLILRDGWVITLVRQIDTILDWNKLLDNSKGIIVVDFWAEWCGPCKAYSPKFEEVSGEVRGVEFVKVNIDKVQEVAKLYDVVSIPATLLFNKGELKGGALGNMSKDELKKMIVDAS